MIILGLLYYFLLSLLITLTAVLIGDVLMIRYVTGISWRESFICGWLYFIDRFKTNG